MIKAKACVSPTAIFLIAKTARQMSRPDMEPAVIMCGNDTVLQEQMKTHKTDVKLCDLQPVIGNQLCGAVFVTESASYISTLSSNKSGS